MDAIIDYNEAAVFLKNPPLLEPRPDYANVCALRKHVIKALSQLFCPQSTIHGWSGPAINPATYFLLEGTAFVIPIDPGATEVYPQWAAPTTVKMADATFLQDKNYSLLYKNIARACFRMFDTNIVAQLKISNTLSLTGWNSMMSVNVILEQLQDSYGKPNMMTLFNNGTLFQSPMTPTNSHEMLFYCIKQCQEIQCIGKLPYSNNQIIANAVRILFQANIFPLKEFNTWEALATKMYPILKTFIHEVYGQCLTAMALRSMSGQNGYANKNMFNLLEGSYDTNEDTVTTITQTAVDRTTTGTTPQVGLAISADITTAITQLAANQTTIMLQMVAMLFAQPLAHHTCQYVPDNMFQVPPIQQVAIPLQQHFLVGTFNAGCGERQGGQGGGRGRGGGGSKPFADYMQTAGAMQSVPSQLIPHEGGTAQIPPPQQ
jgi:hypothetical protein